ncbi:MAG: hypothetical protein WDW36_002666 [Sanguina aurantia]
MAVNVHPNPQSIAASLHGETAAKRQAITELLFFASVGDLYRVRKIVQAWGLQLKDPHCCDYDRRTPLHLAAAEGCFSVVAWLLDLGVEVNPVDRFHRTPLEDAVRGDHGNIATLLIERGGKVMSKELELVELADSPLAGNVRIFTDYDPEWEIDPTNLLMMEKIGEGEFGVVHKASWNGTIVAVKILKETGTVAVGDFRTELNVLQKVHHPYAVQFLGAVTKQLPFMIITEYMTGGSLADIFRKSGFPSLWRSVQLSLDCAKGLAYMHNRRPQAVIHRDLKPANLMLGGPKIYNSVHRKLCVSEIGTLKIADFGLSKSLKLSKPRRHQLTDNSNSTAEKGKGAYQPQNGGSRPVSPMRVDVAKQSMSYKLTGETGSYRYMAPEVFRHEPYNNKVDVYGFAMIMYQLFEGVPPFWTLDPVEAARGASMEGRRPHWGPMNKHNKVVLPALKQLVESCWVGDYEARPEFDDIIETLEKIAKDMRPDFVQDSGDSSAAAPTQGCCTIS